MENISDTDIDTAQKEPEEQGKPSLAYWRSQLEAYDNAAKSWISDVDDAFDEYLNKGNKSKMNETKTRTHFPLFWSCVRTIQPAFYSRTPVVVTEKAFKEMRDPVAGLAAIMYERLGKYGVKTSGFDRAMGLTVTHFIMSEKASVRVVFDADIEETQVPTQGNDGQMMIQAEPSINYLTCDTEPWHYKDAKHTPNARHWGEVDWLSFDTLLTRQEVAKNFGDVVANALTYGPIGQSEDKDRKKAVKGLPAHFATITEIWDRKKRKVYYLSPSHNEWLSHVNNPNGEDPYKLKEFFPCAPFMLGTHGPDDMFTVPAFVQLRDFIEQVHGAFDRVRRLILALKKVGVFDAAHSELAELNAIASEGQFIGLPDLEALLGPQGSLEKLIHFFPTDKVAQGVNELKQAMLELEQKLYDLWGIPDIYRGISDPNETLGAQQLKGKHMSVRFSVLQREVQRLARDTLEIICDLYLGKCPDFKLAEIMGFQHMTPEEQQLFPQALALLKSDSERCIRLEIETDSTITQNMNADIEQKNYLAKTFFEGIAALRDVNPIFMPVAAKAVEIGIKSLQQGKHIESELEGALEAMIQAAQNPPPPPGPPPDLSLQVEQLRTQAKQMELQQEAQVKQLELQQQAVEHQQEMQVRIQEIQLKAQELQADFQVEREKLLLEQQKIAQDGQLEAVKTELDNQIKTSEQALDALRVQVEQFRAELEMKEKFMEERRLRQEQRETELATIQEKSKAQGSSTPAIHIHAAGDGKPKKRKLRITQNEDGSAADIEEILEDAEEA